MPIETMSTQQVLIESLTDLSYRMGSEVLTIPLFTYVRGTKGNRSPIAFTTSKGIWIREDVVRKDPRGVKVYVAHEIWHHVIPDEEVRRLYADRPRLVNYAEDYCINYWLEKLYGYDVRKVGYPGIYSAKHGPMPLAESCLELLGSPSPEARVCGGSKVAHPSILRVAMMLRRRHSNLLDIPKPLFIADTLDEQLFAGVLASVRHVVHLAYGASVNVERLLMGVWMHLYKSKPVATAHTGKELSKEEAMAYCFPAGELRLKTEGSPDHAAIAAALYMREIHQDAARIHGLKLANSDKIRRLEAELTHRSQGGKRDRFKKYHSNKLRRMLSVAYNRKTKLAEMHGIHTLMEDASVQVRKRSSVTKTGSPNTLKKSQMEAAYVPAAIVPSYVPCDITRRLNLLARRAGANLDEYAENMSSLAKMGFPMVDTPPAPVAPTGKANSTDVKDDQLDDTVADPVDNEDEDEDEKSSEQDAHEADDMDEDDPPARETPPQTEEDDGDGDEALAEAQDEKDDRPKNDQQDNSRKQKDAEREKLDAQSEQAANAAAGDQQGAPTRANIGSLLLQKGSFLEKVIQSMNEVNSLLTNRRVKKPSDTAPGADTRYSHGADLGRVYPESVSLLHNPLTRMKFFADLSAHALDVRLPPDRKRYPVCICLDDSGSMSGSNYAVAAGFALAMIIHLHKDKRGVALIIFSERVHRIIVTNPKDEVNLKEILEAVCSPSYGGTNFDAPLAAANAVRDRMKWKNLLTMIVTDGQCTLRDREAVLEAKHRSDRIVAVITNGQRTSIDGVADEVYFTQRNGTMASLVKVGKGLL
jgi:uncharacterized protein with von Willebrand factor type A (vWA) domain